MMKQNTLSSFEAFQAARATAFEQVEALTTALGNTKIGRCSDGETSPHAVNGYLMSMLAGLIADAKPAARKEMLKTLAYHTESLTKEAV